MSKIRISEIYVGAGLSVIGSLSVALMWQHCTRHYTYEEALRDFIENGWGTSFWIEFITCRFPFVLMLIGEVICLKNAVNILRNSGRKGLLTLKLIPVWFGCLTLVYVCVGLIFCLLTMVF